MKKNFLQDVIPASQKRSIRDIPLPSHRSDLKRTTTQQEAIAPKKISSEPILKNLESRDMSVEPKEDHVLLNKEPVFNPHEFHNSNNLNQEEEKEDNKPLQNPPYKPKKARKNPFKKIFVGILIGVFAFGGFLLSRTQARVTIYPLQNSYDIDMSIPVDTVNFATKTQITKTSSMTLIATSEQQVERSATGRIKIINYHAETPQELVKNTRFQTPEGLIYQIRESISIPGYKIQDGKTVPGTLEVEVFASSAGEEYNIAKTKFTIPGFSGRTQFDKITAESSTEMTGGYIGIKKVVSKDATENAYTDLKTKLTSEFDPKPTESGSNIIIPDIRTITYGEVIDTVEGDNVTLTLTASADAYSFKKQDLLNYLGQNTIVNATTSDAFRLDSNLLTYNLSNGAVLVKGTAPIMWLTDASALKTSIAGKKRSEIEAVMTNYKSFERADIHLKPFWKTKFPEDSTSIEIEVVE